MAQWLTKVTVVTQPSSILYNPPSCDPGTLPYLSHLRTPAGTPPPAALLSLKPTDGRTSCRDSPAPVPGRLISTLLPAAGLGTVRPAEEDEGEESKSLTSPDLLAHF